MKLSKGDKVYLFGIEKYTDCSFHGYVESIVDKVNDDSIVISNSIEKNLILYKKNANFYSGRHGLINYHAVIDIIEYKNSNNSWIKDKSSYDLDRPDGIVSSLELVMINNKEKETKKRICYKSINFEEEAIEYIKEFKPTYAAIVIMYQKWKNGYGSFLEKGAMKEINL